MAVTLFISVWLMIRAMHVLSSIVITQILEQALFLKDVDLLFRCVEYIFYYIAEPADKINQISDCDLLNYLQSVIN